MAAPSPQGRWLTRDEKTGQPKSIVRLWVEDGTLFGKIDSIMPSPGKDPDPHCDKCPGDFQGKRNRDIRFLWGLKNAGEEWNGGQVLDPENGKIYRCKIQVQGDDKTLSIRGFIGISLLGRSQTWERLQTP
jgi:uncharacterized protein (DUF2147 family)